MFFYKHLSLGAKLLKIEKELLTYRHHPDCESFSVSRYGMDENEEDTLSLNCNTNSSKVNNMETKGRCSRRVSPGQMEAVYHLECWQAGKKAIPLTHTRESSQGIKTII